MKGFLPDGIYNPFDNVFRNNPGLADIALVDYINRQTTKNIKIDELELNNDDEFEEEEW